MRLKLRRMGRVGRFWRRLDCDGGTKAAGRRVIANGMCDASR